MTNKELNLYTTGKRDICIANDTISDGLFKEYGVNRGLRDVNGKGVLAGLTRISKIVSFKETDGVKTPCDGELWYRGYKVNTLIEELNRYEFGFEKTAYLLLFGEKPSPKEEEEFCYILGKCMKLPVNFTRNVIMEGPSKDVMNSMTKSILTLASYDKEVRMLRPDRVYTRLEAKVLDIVLMLHMEHGGGNNSTFTTRVVTSSGSDTYSAIAAAMSSLKGPKHGGANIKVMEMMEDIRKHVSDKTDREEVSAYLSRIIDGNAFDGKGLIYGMGHAVYSVSDPRERILKSYVEKLAAAKHKEEDVTLYNIIEEEAPRIIAEKRHIFKGVSPNVDFYSGFVYEMLGIPVELYTPLFAIARIVGWSAHRIEEMIGMNKIIRPAYMSVMDELE